MKMTPIIMKLSALMLLLVTGGAASPTSSSSFGPDPESARKNGPQIFNAVHNAMREFGSALHHNGMSLFPGTISEGVLLYHGSPTTEVPETFEWLAFEIDHAETFARGPFGLPKTTRLEHYTEPPPPKGGRPPKPPPFERRPGPGYLHVYQATRPLNILYIDGTAAGKTDMGTLDTQDILLAGNRSTVPFAEWDRARDLCSLAAEWNIDGLVRMEPGFEVIHCDFTDGLRLLYVNQEPAMDAPGAPDNGWINVFEWMRAAASRYYGIGSSRVVLDYSAMVSAFFYPLNLTNPNPKRPELPRLLGTSDAEMHAVKKHVSAAVARSLSQKQTPVDWQGVTDMIVTRYARRLLFIAETDSLDIVRSEVNNLLTVHIDFSGNKTDEGFTFARQRCTDFYLQPVQVRTPEDELIYAAIENTTATICKALFDTRQLLVEGHVADEATALSATKQLFGSLMETLRWAEWKDCGPCRSDEVCFIAMWPFGNVEDHDNPSCLNYSIVRDRNNYWNIPGQWPGPMPNCTMEHSCEKREDLLRNEEL
ncbi:uncharacterized protein GGS25DRAFT_475424 [Hypoxylon fragiforme]|uniref:uncharacterized protein n=1 Tax=Hypoxylon fragiforme TaxID=63214 RepID=UPI0020C5EAA2|nr:uncharacterized protein GGS25DRAFT_475424 [Hypoxylon fragiforme]KAI2612451.1 hypothetical protein GGS25DRAFT_475424 [Hypoxylon fragiforme]